MSQPSYMLPVGVRVIKITHRDVSCHGEQSDHICKKYSDQMNFNEVYTRGGYHCQSARYPRWKQAHPPFICQEIARYINFFLLPHVLSTLRLKKREKEKKRQIQIRGPLSVQIAPLF